MVKLKNIDFDSNDDWRKKLTENEQRKLILIWRKYIKWKDPNNTLNEDDKTKMRISFLDGMLVGILNI